MIDVTPLQLAKCCFPTQAIYLTTTTLALLAQHTSHLLQFTRSRTANLPVYTDFRNGRTQVVTVVRRYSGNVHALAQELRRLLGGAPVYVLQGRLEVEGNHVAQIKMWMAGLGF